MKREKLAAVFFAAAMVLGMAASAGAVDGVIQINQAKVLAAGGFPYSITQPGSYRLVGNLATVGATDAIDINLAAGVAVTIDLNGFSIGGLGSGVGINATSTSNETTVENGTVNGFQTGLNLPGANSIVRNVHADFNRTNGIVTGNNSIVEGCTANSNVNAGITTGNNSRVEGCTANSNPGSDIQTGNNSVIEGCTANSSSGFGIFCQGSGCTISGNTVSGSSVGILAEPSTGYGGNVLNNNGNNIAGYEFGPPTSLNNNVCNGVLC